MTKKTYDETLALAREVVNDLFNFMGYEPPKVVPAENKAHVSQPMYACGYLNKIYGETPSYGMFAGPNPSLDEMLDKIPDGDETTRQAYLFEFRQKSKRDDPITKILFRYNHKKAKWEPYTED